LQHVPHSRCKCCSGGVQSLLLPWHARADACGAVVAAESNPKRSQRLPYVYRNVGFVGLRRCNHTMSSFRQLRPHDNPLIAQIIRDTLSEFGAAKPGTVYFDPTTDDLHGLFQQPLAHYLIAENDGVVVGGCGIFPTPGLPCGYCELVKLYLTPAARGKGIGKRLILCCLEKARELGFSSVYLESMDELRHAVALYEHLGFQHMGAPLGRSGHFGCSIWMAMSLA
jgi:putative acetyltransferase